MSGKNGDYSPSTFASLVLSLSSTAWIGLGKIADPLTGKVKKDLNGAKFSIDTLIMLRDKTKGNLTDDEQKLINGIIADLQANYAETVFSVKEEAKAGEKEEDKKKEEIGEKNKEAEKKESEIKGKGDNKNTESKDEKKEKKNDERNSQPNSKQNNK